MQRACHGVCERGRGYCESVTSECLMGWRKVMHSIVDFVLTTPSCQWFGSGATGTGPAELKRVGCLVPPPLHRHDTNVVRPTASFRAR